MTQKQLIAFALASAVPGSPALNAVVALAQTVNSEGRDPTEAELASITAGIDRDLETAQLAVEGLQAAKAALSAALAPVDGQEVVAAKVAPTDLGAATVS